MMYMTRDEFTAFKSDFTVYGTHTVKDKYSNERLAKDDEPRGVINVMWQPLTDAAAIAEYGPDISRMYYAIVYDDPGISLNDIITIRDEEYEVTGVKIYNTFSRVEVKRKKV